MAGQNSSPLTLTYINLRKIVGLLAMALPLVIFLAEMVFFETKLQTSISAYYYTEVRWYFVLTLISIGFFLFFYQGYDNLDKWMARIAGLAAFSTAIFPTSNPNSEYCASPLLTLNPSVIPLSEGYDLICLVTERVHLASAAIMFITVAIFSLFRFTICKHSTNGLKQCKQCQNDANSNKGNAKGKLIRNKVYRICGGVIAISILVMGLSFLWEAYFAYTVYLGEFVALVAFGVTWAVKGEVLWKDAVPSSDSQTFNKLQSRQVDGYKSGMSIFVFLVAIWFTVLLHDAGVPPFNLFPEDASGAASPLGFEGNAAQGILTGFLFGLVVIVIYFILNNQVLSLFWPLVRRNFRVDLGQDEKGEKEQLWTLFSNQANEMDLSPRFSVNPRAGTGISAPATLTPDSSYLKTLFDLLNWIFPQLGYSLRLTKLSSESQGAGLSLAMVKNDRKEAVAEKNFWASNYKIDKVKDVDQGGDLSVYRYLMIPVYFWFSDVVDRLDGFDPDPRVWESQAFAYLGNALWHSDIDKGVFFFTHSVNMHPENWPAYASLGRVWIEKSQEEENKEIAKEHLLLAISYLETAIEGFRKEKVDLTYFGALYNWLVASFYLSELSDFANWTERRQHIIDNILSKGEEARNETLAALLLLQENPKLRIADIEISYSVLSNKVNANNAIEKHKDDSLFQELKTHPLGSWLINFLPALEFVLLILELPTVKFVKKGASIIDREKEFEVEVWLDAALNGFNVLPCCEEPIDMNRPWSLPESAVKRRRHFTRSHYRIQFNAACFYSMLAEKVKAEKLDFEEYVDLALDHLEMALGVGGGLRDFAKKDSALAVLRGEVRYKKIVKEELTINESSKNNKKAYRSVFRRKTDGKWVHKRHGNKRTSKGFDTQRDAINAAREMIQKQGGGELVIHGEDGKIREKDTIAPGNDPRSTKG